MNDPLAHFFIAASAFQISAGGLKGFKNRSIQLHVGVLHHLRHARRFAAELVFEADDVLGIVEAAAPTAGTLMQEAVTNAGGFATAILDLQQKWWKRYAFLRPRTP